MPRFFVNSMDNFMIQGGIVGFTLQDQKMRAEPGQQVTSVAEDVADIVMREQDFAKLLVFLNQHAKAFEDKAGRPLGGPAYQGLLARAAEEGGTVLSTTDGPDET